VTRKVLNFFLTLAISLGIAEASVRLAIVGSPKIAYELRPPWGNRDVVEDPVLGYRLSPFYIEADQNGYRNEVEFDAVDILAVGDSMTFGYTVHTEDAWPNQMRQATGLNVYNAGIGGYGPCEYLEVVRELQHLDAKTIVVTLYLGNDISDAYTNVYLERRCQELKSDDPEALGRLERAQRENSLKDMALSLGMEEVPWPFEQGLPDNTTTPDVISVKDHFALYRLVRTVKNKLIDFQWSRFGYKGEANDAFEQFRKIKGVVAFDEVHELRTVFRNPDIEILAIDQSNPRIAEGRRVTERALTKIAQLSQDNNAELVVALLAPKSLIYFPALQQHLKTIPDNLLRQIKLDQQLHRDISDFLTRENIRFVDLTDDLLEMINNNRNPYYLSTNEHPNAKGYQVMAKAISRSLQD